MTQPSLPIDENMLFYLVYPRVRTSPSVLKRGCYFAFYLVSDGLQPVCCCDASLKKCALQQLYWAPVYPIVQLLLCADTPVKVIVWPHMPSPTIRHALKECGALPLSSSRYSLSCGFIHRNYIVTVNPNTWNTIRDCVKVQISDGPTCGQGKVTGIQVVLTYKDHRQLMQGGEVN